MSNHFHPLLEVPDREVPDREDRQPLDEVELP